MSLNVDGSCTTVCESQSVSEMRHGDPECLPDRGQLAQTAVAEEGRSVQAAAPELEEVELPLWAQADTSLARSHLHPSYQ